MKLQRAFFLVIALVFLVGFTVTVSGPGGASQRAQVTGAVSNQSIRGYSLVNADTDTIIGPLSDGQTIDLAELGTNHVNIVAETSPSVVGSVAFHLDDLARVVKNSAPYALGGHNNAGNFYAANLSVGDHTLKTQAFTLARARGLGSAVSEIRFSVVGGSPRSSGGQTQASSDSTTPISNTQQTHSTPGNVANVTGAEVQEIKSFTLINADTNQEIVAIENGAVLDIQNLGTTNLTIRANATPTNVGSVKFYLDSVAVRTDNLFPYTNVASTTTDDYRPWSFTPGQEYSITAIPFSLSRARGVEGTPLTVSFTIGQNPVGGHEPVVGRSMDPSVPAMGCLTATVTNDPNGGNNPGTITIDWPDVSGHPYYKAWRIQNGQVEVSTENQGGAVTYNSMTPGTWTIRVAFLEAGALPNTSADWGPESEISNLVISTSIPGPVTTTTCGQEPVESAQLKVFLGGAYNSSTGLMSTALNDANVIPLTEPYTGEGYQFTNGSGSSISSGVLNATGNDAIVDWVIVELRNQNNNLDIVSSRPALLQADGEVVGLNGTTPIFDSFSSGTYYVVVHHRNHLAVMTANPVNISNSVDLTNSTLWGTNAAKLVSGTKVLWPGDVNNDGLVKYTGGNNDRDPILQVVGSNTPNNVVTNAYAKADLNMDSTVKHTGTKNDRDIIFQSIGSVDPTVVNVEQLPQPSSTTITSIQVVNTQGVVQQTLSAGQTINIGTQNGGYGTSIALKANTSTSPVPGSVKYTLTRAGNTHENIDNAAPFSSHGDTGGNYTAWTSLQPGAYHLTALPYDGANATGASGTGADFDFVVVNNDTVAPLAPQNVSINYRSADEIRLSWSPSVGATNYQVVRTGNGQTFPLQSGTTFNDTTGLTSNGTFSYVVTAINSNGQVSPNSTSIDAPTLSPAFTAGTLVAPNANNTQVRALPENPTLVGTVNTTNNGSVVTGTSPSGHVVWVKGVTPAPDVRYLRTTFTSPALSGPGWVDQTKLITYVAPAAPLPPTNFTGSGTSTSNINLTWTDVATNETGYEVQRAALTDTNFTSPTTTTYGPNSNATSISTGLSAGTAYLFRIRAVSSTSGLNSVWVYSAPASISTQAAQTAPNAPTNLTGSASSTSQINLSWTDNANNETGFTLNRATAPDFSSGFVTTNVPANSPTAPSTVNHPVTGLAAGQTYYFQVKAINGTGDSAWATPNPLSVATQNVVAGTCNPGTVAPMLPPNNSPVNDLSRTNGANRSVQLSSAVTGANQITICWDTVAQRTISGSISVYRKSGYTSTSWGTAIATLANTETSYVDNSVTQGTYYEYKVSFSQSSTSSASGVSTNGTAAGYIATGINVPEESSRGKMALVIDNSMVTGTNGSAPTGGDSALMSKVNTLIDDLNADRWTVYPIYVGRGDTVASVKALIVAQNPAAIYLLGHVPVDKTHTMSPDGHGDQIPWSSDAYYSVSGTYGTTVAPVYQIGRVDAFKMEVFGAGNPSSDATAATAGEKTVIGNYLDKVHNYKIGSTTVQQRAIIKDALDHAYSGFTSAQNATVGAWSTFPSVVGLANTYVTNERGTLLTPSLQGSNDTYLLMLAQSGGQCDRDNDSATGTSAGFAAISGGAVFNMAGGSRFGSFDNCISFRENNFLKALLFGGKGMVSLYSLDHHWYLHSLAMGQNIGYATKVSMNNHSTQVYTPVSWYQQRNYNAFMSPLGDPSIRASYFTIPSTFTASGTAGNPINFSWSSVSGAEGYNVYKITSSAVTKLNSSMIASTSYTGSEIYTSGAKYMVTALDLTTSGSGGTYYRESLGKMTLTTGGGGGDLAAPTTPGSFAVSGTTASSVNLTWTASTGNPVGEAVTYKILRSSATNGTYTQVGTDTASPYSDTTVTAGNTYYYRITASDAASNTSQPAPSASTGISATTVDNQAPSAPAGLMSTAQTTGSITLTWNASTGNPVGETINYKVFRSTTANGTYTQTGSSTTNTTFTDSGLTAGTTYYYKVSATDASNNSSAQNPSSGYGAATSAQADTQPPTVPTGLAVTATTASSISLSWNASTDVGGSIVQGYLIYRSATSGGTYDTIGSSSGTSYTDSGLAPNTTYYYKVTAIDNSPNGNQSAQTQYVSGTTAAVTGGGSGQVLGLMGVYAGPNNSEDVTPGANPAGVSDYYVDCVAGNDSNNGTSAATAWRTLEKFNTSGAGQMQPGSRAFFKRGCTFYKTDVYPMGIYDGGILRVSNSGNASNYVEYRAYGTGAAPVFSGAVPVTGWTQHQGNIYKANIGANKNVRYLFANNSGQTLARFPNKSAGNTVWMKTDHITNPGGVSLNVEDSSSTDGALPTSTANNLAGGEYAARFMNWAFVVAPITAHSGQTITVSFQGGMNQVPCYIPNCSNTIYPEAGWGYFVQNKLSLLDTAGEWYYDNASGQLYFWAPGGVNPSTMTVEAAVHRNGVHMLGGIHHVKVKNLAFEKFNKFSYGSSDKGAAVFIQDWDGSSGVLSNIVENVEIKNTPIGVRVEGVESTGPSNGNKILNSYIHDIFDIGMLSYGLGHLYQGNVIENIALAPELAADTDEWNHMYGFVSTGGNVDFIGNIVRNIGYIGVNYVQNGEIRNNLIENISLTINDGCGICADGAENDLLVKRNVVNHVYGNIVGLPSTFVHATALGSGISTGDRNSIGGIFEENVVNDAGNSGITFDNNTFSANMQMRNNTIYTNQPGNSNGAKGISMYDQSVGVYHPGENNAQSLYDFDLGHSVYGNKVYTLHQNNNSLYEARVLTSTSGGHTDFGDYWGNYFFHPYSTNTIVNYRPAPLVTTGDLIWTLTNAPVYSTASTNTSSGTVSTGTKGYISGTESNYRWFVTFNNGQSGWMRSYEIAMAKKNIAEFQQVYNQPPSGQPQNTQRGVGDSLPTLYVNTTGSPMSANIGSGKCGSNGQTLANPYPLNTFADAIVPEICSEQ